MSMRSRGAHLGVLAGLLLTVSACGDTGGGEPGAAPADETTASDPAPLSCPDALPAAETPPQPATSTPSWPALDAAVVCDYQLGTGEDGGWERSGDQREVPVDDLGALTTSLSGLEPSSADQVCTMDMGPRTLLLARTSGGVVGVVAEGYGCRDVLLTADPATVAPGDGGSDLAVPGTFAGTPDLLQQLQSAG